MGGRRIFNVRRGSTRGGDFGICTFISKNVVMRFVRRDGKFKVPVRREGGCDTCLLLARERRFWGGAGVSIVRFLGVRLQIYGNVC